MRTLCLQPGKKKKEKVEVGRSINSSEPKVCEKFFLFSFFLSSHLMSFVWKTYEASQREHIHGGERNTDG